MTEESLSDLEEKLQELREEINKCRKVIRRQNEEMRNISREPLRDPLFPELTGPTPQSTRYLKDGTIKTRMLYPDGTMTTQIREPIYANVGGLFGKRELVNYSFREEVDYSPDRD